MAQPSPTTSLPYLAEEFHAELVAIGEWWLRYSVDGVNGGFFGQVGVDNQPVLDADKGIVLNTRILWFFSEAAAHLQDERFRQAADRAYAYLMEKFHDGEHGGFYWSLTAEGNPRDKKKQVYAQAFAIYALTAYYQLSANEDVKEQALSCFKLLQSRAMDRERGGYLEAFQQDWSPLADVRLSEKDLNFPKTMNTHLHVLEAYTALHHIVSNQDVNSALVYVINLFETHMIDHKTFHLRMFMDDNWRDHSPGYTYGHDIECSWLLTKALDSLGDDQLRQRLRPVVLGLAKACLQEAVGKNGELMEGYDFKRDAVIDERTWWVQAEALVGFLKAFSLDGDQAYFQASEDVWSFIKSHQIDTAGGEWFWLSSLDDPERGENYKMGFWKCPYHNGRAMIEAKRIVSALT